MNYLLCYNEIIKRSKPRGLNKKKLEGYFEKHHIIPRCMQGTNDKDNLVLLTAREHYLCHYLLWKANKDNHSLHLAFHKIRFSKNNTQERYEAKLTSKEYEKIRIAHSELLKGHKHSNEVLLKIGEKSKGRIPWNKGKTNVYSEDTLKAIRDARSKQIITDEHRQNISKALIGRETPWLNGVKQQNKTIEKRKQTWVLNNTKQKMSESAKKRGNSNSTFECSIKGIIFNSKSDAYSYATKILGLSKYKTDINFKDNNNNDFIQHKFQRK